MTDGKKRRMSMLDSLAATGATPPQTSMMTTNRALRSARDAVDSHHVWELDPDSIDDTRIADRLDPSDVHDLREAIEANGQAVPILVRRNPQNPDRYLLVYGRRRLEAIRQSFEVTKIRALVATLNDDDAVKSQISENMARQDLSFIEKANFARQLVDSGFGNQSQVADVLTVTKSSISMAIGIAQTVGEDLSYAIGPAHGIGRPRWEALARAIEDTDADRSDLVDIAERVHSKAKADEIRGEAPGEDPSVRAFEAVLSALTPPKAPAPSKPKAKAKTLTIDGRRGGTVKRSPKGITISLDTGAFADWIESEAQDLIDDLHARWISRAED